MGWLGTPYPPPWQGEPPGNRRAAHAPSASVQNMGGDHGGLDVFMTEQLLNRPEIISVLQEGGREGMLGDSRWQPRTERCDREMRWRGKRVGMGGRCELVSRVGSEELSLLDPIGPPPSIGPGGATDRRVPLPVSACQARRRRGGHWMGDPAKGVLSGARLETARAAAASRVVLISNERR